MPVGPRCLRLTVGLKFWNFSLPGPRVYLFTTPGAFPCCRYLFELATQFPGIATWRLWTWSLLCNQLKALSKEFSLLKINFWTFQFQTCEQLDCYSTGSALSNLRLADSWLVSVHKNTYAVSRSSGLPSTDIFRAGCYSNADVRTFCCKTNDEIF